MKSPSDLRMYAHCLGVQDQGDLTLAALRHIALAYRLVQEMIAQGVDFDLAGRRLVQPALERAWVELALIRARRYPREDLDTSELTRLGTVVK